MYSTMIMIFCGMLCMDLQYLTLTIDTANLQGHFTCVVISCAGHWTCVLTVGFCDLICTLCINILIYMFALEITTQGGVSKRINKSYLRRGNS